MIDKVTVKIINKSNNDLPQYSTPSAAGMDLRANLSEAVTLSPLERKLIPTGIFIELPEGYECQIRPRSGLALKHGISVLNSPGTIDADYRGEIGVILANLSNEPLCCQPGRAHLPNGCGPAFHRCLANCRHPLRQRTRRRWLRTHWREIDYF